MSESFQALGLTYAANGRALSAHPAPPRILELLEIEAACRAAISAVVLEQVVQLGWVSCGGPLWPGRHVVG